ncbi:MAG: folate family ECF transporter S component [Dethiosulfatibacter sp.]|nr:folate family ECF transporter S component [Dethiosulfatibacter sp.]
MKSNTLKSKSFLTTRSLVTVSLLLSISIVLARVLGLIIPIAGLPALKINFSSVPLIMVGIFYGPTAGFMAGAISDVVGYMINPMGGAYFPGFTLSTALTGMIPGLIYKLLKSNKNLIKQNFNYYNAVFILFITGGLLYSFYVKEVLTFDNGLFYNGRSIGLTYIILFMSSVIIYAALPFYFSKATQFENSVYSFDKIYFTVSTTQLITSLILNTYFLSIMFGRGFLVFLPTRIITNYFMIPMFTLLLVALIKVLRLER